MAAPATAMAQHAWHPWTLAPASRCADAVHTAASATPCAWPVATEPLRQCVAGVPVERWHGVLQGAIDLTLWFPGVCS